MCCALILCCQPGFTSFVSLNELRDPARGLLVDDKLRIKVPLPDAPDRFNAAKALLATLSP